MRLGVDTYSLRWQGWDAFQFLDYSAKVGLDNVHFSERNNFASLEESYLKSVKQRADELGLAIEVGMGSFDKYSSAFHADLGTGEEQLIQMLHAAKIVKSPVVRCLLGSQTERMGPVPFEKHVEECVRTLKAAAPVARDLGIKFAVENHGGIDFLARELKAMVEEAGTDYVGVCLDTGNPAWAAEDPVLSTEILSEYAISSHVRDNRVWATPEGAMAQWVPLGQGNTDLKTIIQILKDKAPNPPVDLEIITCIPAKPLPYLVPGSDFFKMYPGMLAQDFARFVAMANAGKPGELDQLLIPPKTRGLPEGELGQKLIEQQRVHFEQSVQYARDVLGIGERGRAA